MRVVIDVHRVRANFAAIRNARESGRVTASPSNSLQTLPAPSGVASAVASRRERRPAKLAAALQRPTGADRFEAAGERAMATDELKSIRALLASKPRPIG